MANTIFTDMTKDQETHTIQIVDWRTKKSYTAIRTGKNNDVKIPPRNSFKLDLSDVAEAQAHADKILTERYFLQK